MGKTTAIKKSKFFNNDRYIYPEPLIVEFLNTYRTLKHWNSHVVMYTFL